MLYEVDAKEKNSISHFAQNAIKFGKLNFEFFLIPRTECTSMHVQNSMRVVRLHTYKIT